MVALGGHPCERPGQAQGLPLPFCGILSERV